LSRDGSIIGVGDGAGDDRLVEAGDVGVRRPGPPRPVADVGSAMDVAMPCSSGRSATSSGQAIAGCRSRSPSRTDARRSGDTRLGCQARKKSTRVAAGRFAWRPPGSASAQRAGRSTGDPLPRGHQLRVAGAGDARHLAAVDQLLSPPRLEGLRADLQVVRDLSDRPPGSCQIENLLAELRRVAPRHNVLQWLRDG
jgi:hypothetical protein